MSTLADLGFVRGKDNEAARVFEGLFEGKTFQDINYAKPSNYVNKYWNAYLDRPDKNNNLNGKVFELIIATLLYREGLLPLYIQAKVAFVPNVDFDALLYSSEVGPIALSMKTSLRERYKQADLEAIALKYVHRRAKAFLLTMTEKESIVAKQKIKDGSIIGLDKIILCSGRDIDQLIDELKAYHFSLAGNVNIIESSMVVGTPA